MCLATFVASIFLAFNAIQYAEYADNNDKIMKNKLHTVFVIVTVLITRKSNNSLLKNLQETLEMEFPSRSTAKKEVKL